jgi:molybdopterin molybdotransferase
VRQLISVEEALTLVLQDTDAMRVETVSLHDAAFRVLGEDLISLRTQPPFPAAAMDGYAINGLDAAIGNTLKVIGESAAGHSFSGSISRGETVRIFTGAPVPEGADTVVMQEDVTALDGRMMRISAEVTAGRHVRKTGLDFAQGQMVLAKGTVLDAANLSLAAASGHAKLPVFRKPRVAILATGDELVAPGMVAGPDQIVASNGFGTAALARKVGAEIIDLGIVGDDITKISAVIQNAFDSEIDVLVTLGGASVGDHDLIKPVLAGFGIELGFWQIAMRPGKPLMHGRYGKTHVLGLPGNPVSSLVCGHLFLVPLLSKMIRQTHEQDTRDARLTHAMRPNDRRQDYVRANVAKNADGALDVTAFDIQDSSMLSTLAASNGLIIRAPNAPAANAGDLVTVMMLR